MFVTRSASEQIRLHEPANPATNETLLVQTIAVRRPSEGGLAVDLAVTGADRSAANASIRLYGELVRNASHILQLEDAEGRSIRLLPSTATSIHYAYADYDYTTKTGDGTATVLVTAQVSRADERGEVTVRLNQARIEELIGQSVEFSASIGPFAVEAVDIYSNLRAKPPNCLAPGVLDH